jgi:hypothetical protein
MNIDVKPSKATPSVAASALIVTGPGALTGIFVTAASSTPTIKLWDNTAGSGTVLIDTFTPAAGTSYYLSPMAFNTGCYITISGTVSCTVLTTK